MYLSRALLDGRLVDKGNLLLFGISFHVDIVSRIPCRIVNAFKQMAHWNQGNLKEQNEWHTVCDNHLDLTMPFRKDSG
jgi:hypothetical protein